MATIRLTAAQAMVRWLCAQRVEVDDCEVPYFAGAWAIFGHGNVAGLGEALHATGDALPTWRAQMNAPLGEYLAMKISVLPFALLSGEGPPKAADPWNAPATTMLPLASMAMALPESLEAPPKLRARR